MKRALKELRGYSILAKDGTKGIIKDFLFDEEAWKIRYLVADLSKISPSRKILIPRVFLNKVDWSKGQFQVELTKEGIENCPDLAEHLPVSQEYEALLHKYYRIDCYWPMVYAVPLIAAIDKPVMPINITKDAEKDDNVDSKLRSFNEVTGYSIECEDKKRGNLKDFIIDDSDWQISYMIVDIGHWYSRSKKAMIAVDLITKINYSDQTVSIDQESDMVENAPEYDPSEPINIKYETMLSDYYGRKVEKVH